MKNQRNIKIISKLINHLTVNGQKNKSEKIALKSFKTLQKNSRKSSKKLVQLALVFSTPIFKINKIIQKKRKKKKQKVKIIPAFISNKNSRVSTAIKFVIATASKKNNQPFFQKLFNEILLSSQTQSSALDVKKETQHQAFLNRNLFKYYRWH